MVLGIGKLLVEINKTHSYLYNFDDKDETFYNWIDFLLPFARSIKFKIGRTFSTGVSGFKDTPAFLL